MNTNLLPINVKTLKGNLFHLLDDEWMLFTAGKTNNFNLMTASWGAFGVLWNKPIAIGFIRPQRYSFEFANANEYFTLSFFPEKYRHVLEFCGAHTGRDTDKVKESGITTAYTENGNVYFLEAHLVFECRKIYADDIKPEKIIDKNFIKNIYPGEDFHRMFVGEIVNCLASANFIEDKGLHFIDTKEGNSTDF